MLERANTAHTKILAAIGTESFLYAHQNFQPRSSLHEYVAVKFSDDAVRSELANRENIFHLFSCDDKPAGYSKLILNCSNESISAKNAAKLERLYLVKEYYGKKIGYALFEANREMCIQHQQSCLWLTVWIHNARAIHFYEQLGLKKVGEVPFMMGSSPSPNHVMSLTL